MRATDCKVSGIHDSRGDIQKTRFDSSEGQHYSLELSIKECLHDIYLGVADQALISQWESTLVG